MLRHLIRTLKFFIFTQSLYVLNFILVLYRDKVGVHAFPLATSCDTAKTCLKPNRSFPVTFLIRALYGIQPCSSFWGYTSDFSGPPLTLTWPIGIDAGVLVKGLGELLGELSSYVSGYVLKAEIPEKYERLKVALASVETTLPPLEYSPQLILFTLFLPGICALFIFIFGWALSAKGVVFINLIATFIVAINSLYLVFQGSSLLNNTFLFSASKLGFSLDNCRMWVFPFYNWEIVYDLISASMCSLVTIVGLLVHFYSYNYLLRDPHLIRFLGYLNLFIFFMLFLVCSDNLTQFFFAWEGVGICSYLLVGFWSTRMQAAKSALKAVLVNKVGDVGLLFAIAYSWNLFKVSAFSHYAKLFYNSTENVLTASTLVQPVFWNYGLTLVCFGYLTAAVAKSAQIGLHTWLPDAMEGPTPVSALIHAATMVTAGIFLIFRLSAILTLVSPVLFVVLVLGSFTAVVAGFVASYQTDLKKVIAYSTCSQLGYMFFACGLTLYSYSLFHLLSHGFFKALLFLLAGAIIHVHLNEQSLVKMAVFENVKLTNLLTLSLYIGFVSLTALPFFSGFYSKEPILQLGGTSFNLTAWVSGLVGYNFGLFAALLTALYSASAFEEILVVNPKKIRSNFIHTALPLSNKISLMVLLGLSVCFGFLYQKPLTSSFQSHFDLNSTLRSTALDQVHTPVIMHFSSISQSLPLLFDVLPLFFCLLLTGVPRLQLNRLYHKNLRFYTKYYNTAQRNLGHSIVSNLLAFSQGCGLNKLWFDYLYNTINKLLSKYGYYTLLKALDKGVLEYFGVSRWTTFLKKISYYLKFTTYKISLEALYLVILFIVLNYIIFL